MPLVLTTEHQRGIDALEQELRAAAEALGIGLRPQLDRLRPGLSRGEGGGAATEDASLVRLDLEHEGAPDALTLAACVAAHRAYVAGRGTPDGFSPGALAISRLLVWLQRAAMLGPAPELAWLGPEPRRPGLEAGQVTLTSSCAVRAGEAERKARATAVLATAPKGAPPP